MSISYEKFISKYPFNSRIFSFVELFIDKRTKTTYPVEVVASITMCDEVITSIRHI
jgi:hypothetical protein